jgi:hypothetical protein
VSTGPLTLEQLTTLIATYDIPGNEVTLQDTLQDAARLGMKLSARICADQYPERLTLTESRRACLRCAAAIRERARK